MAQLLAVVVVDLQGRHGVCSNCNRPAEIDTTHACGAKVDRVAINVEYAIDPTLGQTRAISDKCPSGVEFVGVGRVVSTSGGYRFELTKSPGDLS
jgi:hypothetical protein